MSELKEINKTLEKIERKLEDKNSSGSVLRNFFDYEKREESSRKEREEKRNEEILKLQRAQSDSIKNQENFNKIIAFTGGIIALTTIYTFLVQSINLQDYPPTYWLITVIFLVLVLGCLGPLVTFIFNFWKKEAISK